MKTHGFTKAPITSINMNIFYLDTDPKLCAQMHCDAHVRKMIIEYAQILSTTHRQLCPDDPLNQHRYKSCFVNHPSTMWARQTFENYIYLSHLWYYLCQEYEHRWGKKHATFVKLEKYLNMCPTPLFSNNSVRQPIAQCMPDDVKNKCGVQAYHNYYNKYKRHLHKWTNRPQPDWLERN